MSKDKTEAKPEVPKKKEATEERVLYDSAPSMFRNSPFLFLFLAISAIGFIIMAILAPGWWWLPLLAISAIEWIILAVWWLIVANTRLTATTERITLRTGILSKNIREIFLSDIRSVQINQRFIQRILGTGHVEIASAASSEAEIQIDGIPNAYTVKTAIDDYRTQKRHEKTAEV